MRLNMNFSCSYMKGMEFDQYYDVKKVMVYNHTFYSLKKYFRHKNHPKMDLNNPKHINSPDIFKNCNTKKKTVSSKTQGQLQLK